MGLEPLFSKTTIVAEKANLKEYGYHLATNDKNEMIWIKPLSILNAKEVEDAGMTNLDLLELLLVKATNALGAIMHERQKLMEKMQAMMAAKDKPS